MSVLHHGSHACAWCSGIVTILIFLCLCIWICLWFFQAQCFSESSCLGDSKSFLLSLLPRKQSVTLVVVVQSLSALWRRWIANQQTIFVLTRDPDYTAPLLFCPNYFAPLTFVLAAKSINDKVGVCWWFFSLWVVDMYVECCMAKNVPCRGLQ